MPDNNESTIHSQKFISIGLPILVGTMVLIALLGVLFRYFNADEVEAVHTAWKISQGQRIYVDFFQHHHPLLYYCLVPVILLFGETLTTIIAARILIFIMLLLIVYISYRIAELVFNKNIAWISLFLVTTAVIFMDAAIEIRPDIPQTLFGLLSVFFLLKYYRQAAPNRNLIYSAVSLGLSFLFLQKTIFLIILILMFFLYDGWREPRYRKDAPAFFLAFTATVLPYFLYLIFTKSWGPYVIFNWVINIAYLNSTPLLQYIFFFLAVNIVLCASFVVGLFILPKRFLERRLALLVLGLLLSLVAMRVPRQHYFLSIVPLASPIAAYAFYALYRHNKVMFKLIVIITVIVGASALLVKIVYYSNRSQLARWAFISYATQPTDYVYIGGTGYNLFRRDLDFFWFAMGPNRAMATYQKYRPYHYDIYELINKYQPKLITNTYIDNMDDKRIADHYKASGVYDDLFVRVR